MTLVTLHLFLRALVVAVGIMANTIGVNAQLQLSWKKMASLPGNKGRAGMFAGVINETIICMGGTDFPDKKPWEGGRKKWSDDIYMLENGSAWITLKTKMREPLAYGVSVSYKDKLIVAGGCNEYGLTAAVTGYQWDGRQMEVSSYPGLPRPLAFMTGTLINSLIIVAGGSFSLNGPAERICYVLDLENLAGGWSEIGTWPGPERMYAQCASYDGRFFLFGGETTELNLEKIPSRRILSDAYCLNISGYGGKYKVVWETRKPMPVGICSGPNPLPVFNGAGILFWGGVDAVGALNTEPLSYKGNNDNVLLYSPGFDKWSYLGKKTDIPARADLTAVYWKGSWVFISGEIKPGVRTGTVYAINRIIQEKNN